MASIGAQPAIRKNVVSGPAKRASANRKSTQPSTSERERTPEFEEIARLAYSYWEARGGGDGSPEADWFRAERELREAAAR